MAKLKRSHLFQTIVLFGINASFLGSMLQVHSIRYCSGSQLSMRKKYFAGLVYKAAGVKSVELLKSRDPCDGGSCVVKASGA